VKTFGFVGLGSIGYPMARCVAQSVEKLRIYDINEKAVQFALSDLGQRVDPQSSPAAVAENCEVAILSLPSLESVREVVLGERGLVHGKKIKVIVDLSTTGTSFAQEMAQAVAKKNIAYVDAPVSGAIARAKAGTLTLMCSGPRFAFDAAKPALEAMGRHVHFLGEETGLGQAMKLVNNTLLIAAMTISFEAMVFGVKAGLDPDVMIEILNTSTGKNYATEFKIPQDILSGTFASGGKSGLTFKDISLYLDEAEKLGAPMWSTRGLREIWSFVVAQGGSADDNTAMIKHLERWAGVEVRGKAAQIATTSG
jgi:2-hydroxy-3-oxopropionate reductase